MGRDNSVQKLYRQWVTAIKYKRDPRHTEEELKFLQKYLSDWERALYNQMEAIDQRHALDVAFTVRKDPRITNEEERALLIRAALLHDIGKVKGDFTISQRVMVKLIYLFFPNYRKKLLVDSEKSKRGTLKKAVYVQDIHSKRGAHMLCLGGAEQDLVQLVKNHHGIPRSRLERCLQDADNQN